MHVCITSPDSLHALPRVDKTNVVIGAEKVIKITFPEFIGLVVVNFQVSFICISIFPKKGSTPGGTIVINPG